MEFPSELVPGRGLTGKSRCIEVRPRRRQLRRRFGELAELQQAAYHRKAQRHPRTRGRIPKPQSAIEAEKRCALLPLKLLQSPQLEPHLRKELVSGGGAERRTIGTFPLLDGPNREVRRPEQFRETIGSQLGLMTVQREMHALDRDAIDPVALAKSFVGGGNLRQDCLGFATESERHGEIGNSFQHCKICRRQFLAARLEILRALHEDVAVRTQRVRPSARAPAVLSLLGSGLERLVGRELLCHLTVGSRRCQHRKGRSRSLQLSGA